MNYSRRHSYYVNKTIRWLESNGLVADKVEYSGMVGGHYTKRDLWGADIIYRSRHCIGFIQLKTSQGQMSKGRRQLSDDGSWPSDVGRYVLRWEPRTRLPIIQHADTGEEVVILHQGQQGLPVG